MSEPAGISGIGEEREVKLAVAGDLDVMTVSELPGVVVSDRGVERLHAIYWDTAELALAQAGVGIRHRNGTWTFKGRSRREGDAVVREELEVDAEAGTVPIEIGTRLAAYTGVDALRPVAELDTERHTFDVSDAEQRVEVVHDRVRILASGKAIAAFTEVEVEHMQPSQGLADAVVRTLVERGAVVDPTAKLVRALRALGHAVPAEPG